MDRLKNEKRKKKSSMQFQKNSLAASGSPAAGSDCRSPARTSRCRSPAGTRRGGRTPGRAPRARPTSDRRAASRRRAGAAASGAGRRRAGRWGRPRGALPGPPGGCPSRRRRLRPRTGRWSRSWRRMRKKRRGSGEKNDASRSPVADNEVLFSHSLSLSLFSTNLHRSPSLLPSFSRILSTPRGSRSFSLPRGRARACVLISQSSRGQRCLKILNEGRE